MTETRGLREAYALLAERPATAHPDEDAWERLACDEVEPTERQAILDHAIRCAACERIYRGLTLLRADASAFDPQAPRPATEPARWSWRHTTASGLAALAATLLLAVWRPALPPAVTPDPETVRGAPTGAPGALVALAPMGRLSEPPREFHWHAVSGRVRYRVQLLSGEGQPLWTSDETDEASLARPSTLRLGPGGYYWQVLARPLDGGDPVACPMVRFEIP